MKEVKGEANIILFERSILLEEVVQVEVLVNNGVLVEVLCS